ncbi:MAG: glycosyltransferase family 4 protein [Gammaproteobacteria bacterium]|nr:glycosyltransferase family 4 protein [Gammaproteobacteria bacterium]MDH3767974.1 glycosyltransferase family 4 protein [Gammaproteobacteria bacterium]
MNILSINKFYYRKGGSETVFFGEKELLERNGHRVIPFSMHDPRNEESDYARYFVRGVDYETTRVWDKLSAAGKIVFSFEARRNISKLLGDHKVDIAHFHIFQHQISPSVFEPLRKRGIPIVLTLHDLKPVCPTYLMYTRGEVCEKCMGGKFYHCMLRKCTMGSTAKSLVNVVEMYFHYAMRYYQNVDRYVAVSRFYRDKMIEAGFPGEQIEYIPNFIDSELFQYSEVNRGYALYFGRLSEEKGLITLLEAAEQCPEVPIVIAGAGPDEDKLKQHAAEKKLANVEFVGFQTGDKLRALLAECSFTVLPSVWYENCPMSVLESLAVGKPVAAARSGGIPELVEDGVDGFCFKPRDAGQLAQIMTELFNNNELREKMGPSARAKIERRFSPKIHTERLQSVYDDLLNRT